MTAVEEATRFAIGGEMPSFSDREGLRVSTSFIAEVATHACLRMKADGEADIRLAKIQSQPDGLQLTRPPSLATTELRLSQEVGLLFCKSRWLLFIASKILSLPLVPFKSCGRCSTICFPSGLHLKLSLRFF